MALFNQGVNSKTAVYDALNRPVSETDWNGNTTKYTLDGNGNIVTVTDAAEIESHYAYDSMNRLTKVSLHLVDMVQSR